MEDSWNIPDWSEINLILTLSAICVITHSTDAGIFKMTDTKLYIPVVTQSTLDNRKLLEQLKSRFKKTINWKKYKTTLVTVLKLLNWSKFSGSKQKFCSTIWGYYGQKGAHMIFFPKVEIKDNNVDTDGQNIFWSANNNDKNIWEL